MLTKPRLLIILGIGVILAAGVAVGIFVSRDITPSATPPAPATPAQAAATKPTAPTFTMNGAFVILVGKDSTALQDGAACRGVGDYANVGVGAPVRVYGPQGDLLTTGQVGDGKFFKNALGAAGCNFDLKVSDVPDGLLSYSVQVGVGAALRPVASADAHRWVGIQVFG